MTDIKVVEWRDNTWHEINFWNKLIIYKDGRVVYQGRELGSDPEIFEAIKNTFLGGGE